MRFFLLLFAILIPTFLPFHQALAHPHAFVDVRIEVLFDQEGRVSALRQHWLFDEFYTAFATDGLDGDGDGKPDADALQKLAELNLKNLSEFNYFTITRTSDDSQDFETATDISSIMKASRLEMTFTLPLEEPLDANQQPVTYAVFDPTYYVEMLHAESDEAIRLDGAPDGCGYSLKKPAPDPDMVAFAASLDKTQSGGNDLGLIFAEQVTLSCGS